METVGKVRIDCGSAQENLMLLYYQSIRLQVFWATIEHVLAIRNPFYHHGNVISRLNFLLQPTLDRGFLDTPGIGADSVSDLQNSHLPQFRLTAPLPATGQGCFAIDRS